MVGGGGQTDSEKEVQMFCRMFRRLEVGSVRGRAVRAG